MKSVLVLCFVLPMLELSLSAVVPKKTTGSNMGRRSAKPFWLLCYDDFLLEFNAVTQSSKAEMEACIANAGGRRDMDSQQVSKDCKSFHPSEGYSDYWENVTDTVQSMNGMSDFSSVYDRSLIEEKCVISLLQTTKNDIDMMVNVLQDCIMKGYLESKGSTKLHPTRVQYSWPSLGCKLQLQELPLLLLVLLSELITSTWGL